MQPGAPAPAPQAPQAEPGGATKLVTGIHSQMAQLMDILDQSPVDPEDKQALAQVITQYQAFVEGLASAPGQQKAPQAPMPGPKGPMPMEAGASEVKPAL